MSMAQVHNTIKSLRESNQLTQKQVADFLEISQQAYSYYELNKRELPSRHVVSLSKMYKVSTDYILGVNSGYTDPYDLDSKYIHEITLKDMIYNLEKLNKSNRQDIVRYISYLKNTQNRSKTRK